MTFKRLEIGIFFRLIAAFCADVRSRLLLAQPLVRAGSICGFPDGDLVVIELAGYVTRSNNELAKFILAVKYRDFSQQFNENHTNPSLKATAPRF